MVCTWERYSDIIDNCAKCILSTLFACLLLTVTCSIAPRYTRGPERTSNSSRVASEDANSFTQIGYASYYANKFNGKKTASGELYYKDVYTAAHRTLPFNTIVKVTNLKNNRSVVVRINDRGPFSNNRIIDISHSAAVDLGIIKKGVEKVKIEVVQ